MRNLWTQSGNQEVKCAEQGTKGNVESFFASLQDGEMPISVKEIFSVTKASFAALKSLQEDGMPVKF